MDTNVKYGEHGQYEMWVDHQLIGFARTRDEGETTVAEVVSTMQAMEPPPSDAPGTDCPEHGPTTEDDCPDCQCCGLSHHIQKCSAIRDLLFAPFTDVCISCGDQLHYDAPLGSICGACSEWEGATLPVASGAPTAPFAKKAA